MTDLTERKVRCAVRAARDKKAVDVVVLDVRDVSSVADYFLICSGRSTTHADTIAEGIRADLKADGHRALHVEGSAESGWLLLDYGDLLAHVFLDETRVYYALERLWGDAPAVTIEGR